VDNTPSSAGLP